MCFLFINFYRISPSSSLNINTNNDNYSSLVRKTSTQPPSKDLVTRSNSNDSVGAGGKKKQLDLKKQGIHCLKCKFMESFYLKFSRTVFSRVPHS